MTCRNSDVHSTRFPHLSFASTDPADLSISGDAFDTFAKIDAQIRAKLKGLDEPLKRSSYDQQCASEKWAARESFVDFCNSETLKVGWHSKLTNQHTKLL